MQEPTRYIEIILPLEGTFCRYFFDDLSNLNKRNRISPLSLINIFIGENNSGKSQLLRSLFSLIEFDYNKTNNDDFSINSIRTIIDNLNNELTSMISSTNLEIRYENKETQDKINVDQSFLNNVLNQSYYHSLADLIREAEKKLDILTSNNISCVSKKTTINMREKIYENAIVSMNMPDEIKKMGQNYRCNLEKVPGYSAIKNEKRYYIPILRGMRPLGTDDQYNDFYKTRTYKDYFQNSNLSEKNQQIFTGIELYQSLKEKLLGDPEDRKLVKEFEDFLSKKFFDFQPFTLIPKDKPNQPKVVNVKIGDEEQFPIYDLGDGLQNLIICTFKIFTEKDRCLFFIEEPDMFMHPSFQRAFLEVLCEHDQH